MRLTSNDRKRPVQFSLRTLLLLFVAVAVLIVLFNPRIVTGHFCYITIDGLDVTPEGGFYVKYSRFVSPGTKVALVTPHGGSSGATSGGTFMWYVRSTGAGGGGVNLQRLGLDAKDWMNAIKVEQGKRYRIELNSRLQLYEVRDSATGQTYEAYIEFDEYARR